MQAIAFPAGPSPTVPIVETPTACAYLLAPGDTCPRGTDVIIGLADGLRLAYAPRAPLPDGTEPPAQVVIDPFVRGNSFKPIHDSPRAHSAQLSIAAARRVDTGPESERLFLFLRGNGLVFEENGDTHRFAAKTLVLAPAGEPARVWSQGPEDTLAIVFQPKGPPSEKRTLKGEIAKRRAESN